MKKLFVVCIVVALTVPVMAAELPFENQIRELESQLITSDQQVDPDIKEQLNELYALRPENQRPEYDPLDQGNDFCPGTQIRHLPYSAFGTTAGYENNYVPLAPCGTSNAPDVVYYLVAPFTGNCTVSLCASSFDTYLYVVTGECGFTQVACNDDFCGVQSQVTFQMIEGQDYTIFVDGYSTFSGSYVINVTDDCVVPAELTECVEQPGEHHSRDDCNGGCTNLNYFGSEQYQNIDCGQTAVGLGFINNASFAADRDWYAFTLAQACTVRVHGVAEFPYRLGIFSYGCPTETTYALDTSLMCSPMTVSTAGALPAGDYIMFVRAHGSTNYQPFVSRIYQATLECIPAGGGLPAAPSNLVIKALSPSGARRLNWSSVVADTSGNPIDVSRYVIYRSANAVAWDSIGTPAPPDTNYFVDFETSEGRRFYQVRAVAE